MVMLRIHIILALLASTVLQIMASSNEYRSKWSVAMNVALDSFHISKEFVIIISTINNHTEIETNTIFFPSDGESASGNLRPNETVGSKFYGKGLKDWEDGNAEKLIVDFHEMTGGVMLLRVDPISDQFISEDTPRTCSGQATVPVVFLLQHETHPLKVIQLAMASLSLLESWSPRAPHFIALKDGDENEGTVAEVLGELWRHKVSRAAVLQNGPEGFLLRWWAPQGQGKDCQGPSIQGLATVELSPYAARRALPQRRPYNYFSGCTLKCSTFTWLPYSIEGAEGRIVDGLDFRILEEIRKQMNFTTIYSLPHETYFEAGTNVSNGHAHFSLGAFTLVDMFYPAMDPTVAYWISHSVWFVPTGLPIPRWLSVTRVFSGLLWLCVLLSCILVAGAFTFLQVHRRDEYEGPGAVHTLWILLGINAQEPSSPIGSWIFAVWLISSLIINSAYQSGLIGFLANPGVLPPLSTIDELLQSNMKILMHPEYKIAMQDIDDPAIQELILRSISCEDALLCIDHVGSSKDSAFPIEVEYIDYGYKGEGRNNIKILAGIITMPIHTLTQKGSPLLEWFDFYITGMVEGNLNGKWWKEIIGTDTPLGANSNAVKMAVEHLQGAFFILLFGLLLSLTVFLKEIMHLPRCKKYMLCSI